MSSPQPGDRLGPYRLLRELGEGGMGRVLLAEHPRRGRVCVKILPAHRRENFKSRRRFRREAEAARRLRHPNIVRAWGLEEHDGVTIIVQEYVSGGDLTQLLETRGALSVPEALHLTRDIAEGLVVAHRAGFVHRDLKPDNILLDRDGRPRIADFGLVLQVGGEPVDGQTILTVSGRALGSPGYIAPEQWRDAHSVDARADHYSLGIMLHEMLTGSHPMAELKTMTEVMQAHLERPLPTIPGVASSVMAFIAWLTEKDPADRPADAVRVLARLDELCAEAGEVPKRELQVKVTPTGRMRRPPNLDSPRDEARAFVGLDAYAKGDAPESSRQGSDRPDRHATLDLADEDDSDDSRDVRPALFGSEDSRPIFAEAPGRRPPTIKVRRHDESDRVRVRAPAPEPPSGSTPRPAATDTTLAADAIEKLERVGEGGMGIVWRVHDRRLGREAALKVVRGGAGDAERRRRRFLREARITATLSHPAIPPIYETGRTPEGDDYILMKLIEGETLRERIRALHSGPVARSQLIDLLEVLVKVAEAIAFAHSRGILHRDLKPHNIMVGAFGEVMVLDWGLARAPGQLDDSSLDGDKVELDTEELSLLEDARAAGLTISGSVIGTPGYAAPEQLDGKSDQRSDVFALGALLTEILTGHAAIPGRTPIECIAATLEGRRRESRRSAAIAPEFYALAEAALAHKPEQRLPSAEVFVRELRAAIAGEDSGLMRTNPLRRLSRLMARNPAPVAVAGLLTLLSLGLAFFAVTSQRIRREAHRAELAEQAVLARDAARRELDHLIAAVAHDRLRGVAVAEACEPLLRTFEDSPHERVRIARLLVDAGLRQRGVALLTELSAARPKSDASGPMATAIRLAAARALFERHRLELEQAPLDAGPMTPALEDLLDRPGDELSSGLTLYAKACRALVKGDALAARQWLSRLDAGPDWIPVAELQARARLERPADARRILDPAIAKAGATASASSATLPRLLMLRAELHRRADRLNDALADLTALTVLRPTSLPVLIHRAEVLEALGHDDEALAAWRAVIAQHPEDAEAFRRLRKLLVARGNLESALRELDKQLSLQPSPELHAQRAGICDRLFQWPEALRSWSLAIARAPEAPALRLGRAQTRRALLESLRRAPSEEERAAMREDLALAAKAIDPGVKATALRELATELLRGLKPSVPDLLAAQAALTEACQVEPENPRNLLELAGVELARGALPKARTALKRALEKTKRGSTPAAVIDSQNRVLDKLGPADKPRAHPGLLDELAMWDAATHWQRLSVARQIEARIGARDWQLVDCRAFRCHGERHHVAIFRQVLTGELFHLIPGGPTRLGRRAPKDARADAGRSARTDMPETAALRMTPFLIARDELNEQSVARLLASQDINALVGARPAELSLRKVRALLNNNRFGLRLPDEHEWEYAARAGSRDRFPWGPAFDARRAWYKGNAGDKPQNRELRPDAFNAFGLSDVIGNLAEWALESRDRRSPKAPRTALLRGGSFRDDPEDLRVTRRQSRGASPRGGLRPVRDL